MICERLLVEESKQQALLIRERERERESRCVREVVEVFDTEVGDGVEDVCTWPIRQLLRVCYTR